MAEVQKPQSAPEKVSTANIDVTEIISKVRDLVNNIKEIAGKPMDVSVDSFNFSVGKMGGELDVSFNTKIVIKPKPA